MKAPVIGTGIKLNVNIAPIGDYHMSDYDFECLFFTSSRADGIVVTKAEMTAVDNDNYLAVLDSSKLGSGRVYCLVTAMIPDGSFEGGYRVEKAEISTNEVIYQ
jgi:hypothetical protein